MPTNVRSWVGGNYVLALEGVNCGFLTRVAGGAVSADVIEERVGPDQYVRKHIGQPKYEDFAISAGLGMAGPFWDWVKASWEMVHKRKNGSVIACDYSGEARSEREFFNALLTETVVPALDGASKDAAVFTLKFSPEMVRTKKGDGKKVNAAVGKQPKMLANSFRLEIDGLDCKKVSKIDSFSVKQKVSTEETGDLRDFAREPGKLDFPNLRVTFSAASAEPWQTWFESFVIKGENEAEKEKNGTLTFLAPNQQDGLAAIKLFNLGIFRLSDEPQEARSEGIHRMTAELYCERMEFVPPKTK